jgi:cytochrome c-type biogenesis protein CcmH/NrfG
VSMMAFMQTDANFLNFSMSTVVVSLVFALLLLAAGLYTRAGTPQQAEAEEAFRHRQATVAHAP